MRYSILLRLFVVAIIANFASTAQARDYSDTMRVKKTGLPLTCTNSNGDIVTIPEFTETQSGTFSVDTEQNTIRFPGFNGTGSFYETSISGTSHYIGNVKFSTFYDRAQTIKFADYTGFLNTTRQPELTFIERVKFNPDEPCNHRLKTGKGTLTNPIVDENFKTLLCFDEDLEKCIDAYEAMIAAFIAVINKSVSSHLFKQPYNADKSKFIVPKKMTANGVRG